MYCMYCMSIYGMEYYVIIHVSSLYYYLNYCILINCATALDINLM